MADISLPSADEDSPLAPAPVTEWPPCPRCGSSLHVHRSGLHIRLQYKPAQKFSCTACGKNHKFLAPSEIRFRPGRIRRPPGERLKQFRERLGPPATVGRWKIRPELARSLVAMYRSSYLTTPEQWQLDKFVSELIESAVSDFRLLHPQECFNAFGRPVLREAKKQVVDPLNQARIAGGDDD